MSGDLLIVVPCLNEEAHLEGLLSGLLADPAAAGARLVVADGGSTDRSREITAAFAARDPRVILMDNPRRIQSAGVNRAVDLHGAGRRWLLRVDAHADYPPDYASALLAEAARTGADSVVVAMISRGEAPFQRAAAAAQNSILGAGGSRHRRRDAGGWVDHGHHALMRLDLYRAVGGYDETFPANEDAELDLRLTRAGGRIWLSGEVVIGYHPRRTARALFRQYLAYGEGRARTLLRWRARPKLRQLLPLGVAPAAALAPFGLIEPLLAAPAALWAAAAAGYGLTLAARMRDPWAALSGPAAMVMHLGWAVGFWRRLARAALGAADVAPPASARVARAR